MTHPIIVVAECEESAENIGSLFVTGHRAENVVYERVRLNVCIAATVNLNSLTVEYDIESLNVKSYDTFFVVCEKQRLLDLALKEVDMTLLARLAFLNFTHFEVVDLTSFLILYKMRDCVEK